MQIQAYMKNPSMILCRPIQTSGRGWSMEEYMQEEPRSTSYG